MRQCNAITFFFGRSVIDHYQGVSEGDTEDDIAKLAAVVMRVVSRPVRAFLPALIRMVNSCGTLLSRKWYQPSPG